MAYEKFARGLAAQRALSAAFERGDVRKRYQAVVQGRMTPPEARGPTQEWEGEPGWGLIDLPLMADWPQRPLQKVAPEGRASRTLWRILAPEANATQVELVPLTGRTHQLRVHLAAAGAPILHDPFYGDPKLLVKLSDYKRGYKGREEEKPMVGRLALHASALRLKHPATKEPFEIRSPLPHEFEIALKYLGPALVTTKPLIALTPERVPVFAYTLPSREVPLNRWRRVPLWPAIARELR
jgi:23S rRNA-/tRNA-specific pseudouridylate synthase